MNRLKDVGKRSYSRPRTIVFNKNFQKEIKETEDRVKQNSAERLANMKSLVLDSDIGIKSIAVKEMREWTLEEVHKEYIGDDGEGLSDTDDWDIDSETIFKRIDKDGVYRIYVPDSSEGYEYIGLLEEGQGYGVSLKDGILTFPDKKEYVELILEDHDEEDEEDREYAEERVHVYFDGSNQTPYVSEYQELSVEEMGESQLFALNDDGTQCEWIKGWELKIIQNMSWDGKMEYIRVKV